MKQTLVYDTEVYRDYFLLSFKHVENGLVRSFEMYEGHPFDIKTVRSFFDRYRVVSFNGINFDLPIITEALRGADCAKLKAIANKIIQNNLRYWQIGIEPIKCDHIDLIEVAPGMASLKIYGGRLHCRKMQDLPIDPDDSISPEDRETLRTYCENDLDTTITLFKALHQQLALRDHMTERYGVDLRSKSDAQIAEAVITRKVREATGRDIDKPEIVAGTFQYRVPDFLKFTTPELQGALDMVRSAEFVIPDDGRVQLPQVLAKAAIRIGNGSYRMGIGGLHSSEQTASHYSDDDHVLFDRDVRSYYPTIILNLGLRPKQMGNAFLQVYRGIVEERLAAKDRMDVISERMRVIKARISEIKREQSNLS
jgi:hypothetical protein